MTPMRANVVGPPSVATSIRASIAARRSGAMCSAFGSFRAAESMQGRCCRHCPPCCRRAKSSVRHRDRVGAGRAIPGWAAWIGKLRPPFTPAGCELKRPPGNIRRPPGSKLLAFENARPPRLSETCIGGRRERIKTAVPSKEQRSCAGGSTHSISRHIADMPPRMVR
jgi:hypothetical protein